MFTAIQSLIRNLVRRERADARLGAELAHFAELIAAEHEAAGLTPTEARRRAMIEIGGLEQVKENVRDVRRGATIEQVTRELRFASRRLLRAPAFTLTTLLTLALGIGATVVVLAITDAVLVRPLPYRDADRLITVLGGGNDPVAPGTYLDWKSAIASFQQLEAAEYWTPTFTDGEAEQITALHVTPGMMAMLGARPVRGRGFTAEADGARELLISDALWRRRFAADSAIAGRVVHLGGDAYVVAGVMAPDFQFAPFWATDAQAWAPLPLAGKSAERTASSLRLFGRLGDGVTLAAAQKDVDLVTRRLAAAFPESNRNIVVTSLKTKAIGNATPALITLVAAVAFVLAITWINAGHMLLARAFAREREIGMRVALGAGRGRIIREAVIESAVLAFLGGALGTAAAAATLRLLASRGPFDLPQLSHLALDARATIVAVALIVTTAAIVAILPAWLAHRAAGAPALRFNARGATGGAGRTRLRQILIASEMAFAVVLLIGTTLAVRSFVSLREIDPGFDAAGLMTMQVPMPRTADSPGQRIDFYDGLKTTVLAMPGVRDAGFINHLPLAGDEWGTRTYGGAAENATESTAPRSIFRVITPGLLPAMGIRRISGRDVTALDDLDHPDVVIINRRLATQLWPGAEAVGQRVTFAPPGGTRAWTTVIGVVEDVKQSQWTAASDPEVYLPFAQSRMYLEGDRSHTSYLTMVVRATGDVSGVVAAVRRFEHEADPSAPITHIQAMSDVVYRMTARARFLMSVLLGFSTLALALAGVGIYGVTAYSVAQRRQEIGIRIALGATANAISAATLRQTVGIAGAGVLAGSAGAWMLSRLASTQLYGVGAHDPVSFTLSGVVLVAVAIAASIGPVLRAAHADPLRAIREE